MRHFLTRYRGWRALGFTRAEALCAAMKYTHRTRQ
jgi:hypothetical protein